MLVTSVSPKKKKKKKKNDATNIISVRLNLPFPDNEFVGETFKAGFGMWMVWSYRAWKKNPE